MVARGSSARSDRTGEGTREERRDSLDTLSTPRIADWHEAVSDLFERVCAANGGAKGLAGGTVPLSYPHLRKLAADGSLPNLEQILLFVRLAGPKDPFRQDLIDHLSGLFRPSPDQIAAAVEARVAAGASVGEAVREVVGMRPLWPDVEPRRIRR